MFAEEHAIHNSVDLDQRLVIIQHSGIDDAKILDENYKLLIWQAGDNDEKQQLEVLRSRVQIRIKELTAANGKY